MTRLCLQKSMCNRKICNDLFYGVPRWRLEMTARNCAGVAGLVYLYHCVYENIFLELPATLALWYK
jgi:hypothetical protein